MIVGPLKVKAQIFCGPEPAIGPGKAALLEAIAKEGSISAAGRALGMSYRRTWLLVDSMNRCFTERLVDTMSGGGATRGARLSAAGQAALRAYRDLERRMTTAADGAELATLRGMLREAPLPFGTHTAD